MAINTEVYGVPETWGTSNLTGAGFKWVNFNDTTGAKPRLMDGAELDKTPHDELIENSICTQALGTESKYSHIIIENAGEFYHCDFDYVPWFLSESDDTEGNSQNYVSTIQLDNHINSWKPYRASTYYWNYSDYCRPFAEWKHKKLLFDLKVQLRTSADITSTKAVYSIYDITPEILNEYPFASFAYLEAYVDGSQTDTPSRTAVNQYSQFGICPNVEFTIPDIDSFQIDYACFKSMVTNGIPIWGLNTISFNEGSQIINIGLCEEEDINVYSNGVVCAREYTEEFQEYLIEQAACLGLFVRIANDSNLDNSVIPLDNNDIILGVLREGIGHGDYTRGAANRNNDIWNWGTNQDSDFDPYITPHSEYDTDSHFNNVTVASFNKVWVMNYTEVQDLIKEVYRALALKPPDTNTLEYSADTFLVTDPIDGILSIRRYPVNTVPNDGTPQALTIGSYTSQTVTAYRFLNAPGSQFIDFEFSRNKRFDEIFGGSFLDRDPYTQAELYIPFCGTVPISVADYIGHTIRVKLAIDYRSGACTAYILCDNTPLQSANGQIGIDIAVSGINSATVDSQLLSSQLRLQEAQRQTVQAASAFFTTPLSIAGSAATGGKFGAAQAAGSVSSLFSMGSNFNNSWDNKTRAEYDLHHIQTPSKSISTGSPTTAAMGEHCCRLTIYRPILMEGYDPEKYGHTVGFSVLLTDTLSNHSGYCVTASCDLSGVTCTAEERSMIDSALKGGVYL